ncbi:MAG: hypothetical protein HY319_26625 [Armatimonadetes bacterium]|nr:hypothetical protein [Armatimonadota bacterium]
MEWTPLQLFPPSDLRYQLFESSFEESGCYCILLMARWSGLCRDGSAGADDAAFMSAVTAAALNRVPADVVVFDFTDLEYRWGNSLLSVFETVGDADLELPIAVSVAAGPGCLPALSSLVTPAGEQTPEWLKDNLEDAVALGRRQARARAEVIG